MIQFLNNLDIFLHTDAGKNTYALISFVAILTICYFYQKEKKNERV